VRLKNFIAKISQFYRVDAKSIKRLRDKTVLSKRYIILAVLRNEKLKK